MATPIVSQSTADAAKEEFLSHAAGFSDEKLLVTLLVLEQCLSIFSDAKAQGRAIDSAFMTSTVVESKRIAEALVAEKAAEVNRG